MGDSYIGLKVLKNQLKINKNLKFFFENKYYKPELHLKLVKNLLNFANTSIDISDGLIADLEKMINNQKLSYKIDMTKVPISKQLQKILVSKKLNKRLFVSKGDDYQILFTATPSKSRIINKTSKSLGIKISKIGKICSTLQKSQIIDQKGNKIALNNKGYYHRF